MLITVLLTAGAIFLILLAWVAVQRWAANQKTPEECNIPRQECHHCIMADSCAMRPKNEDARQPDDADQPR